MNMTNPQKDAALILIVDDDRLMRIRIRQAMQQAGYQVAEASDGEQGLAAYTRLHPDIVLLDALMPVMDGFTCCAKLQTLPNGDRTPVLIITALEDQESVERAFAAGAVDYVTKPIHWAVLRQRVRRLLQVSRATEELRQQTERTRLFADVTLKIRQSLQLEEILQTTVTEVQKLLQADRVLIYRLWADGTGRVVTEAVVPGWPAILKQTFPAEVFPEESRQLYRQGRIRAIEDVENGAVPSCLVEFLQQWRVKAKLVVPINLKAEWGLLIVHQCSNSRQWADSEIELLQHLADQIGIALAQAQLLEAETQRRQELARSNAELQQFAYIASHDLQEPLRKIQAFGNQLKERFGEVLSDQGRDYIERMQNASQRMQNLINDLLTLSRLTTKAQPFVAVNLTQVAQEVLSDLEFRIQQTNGQVFVGELPTIDADPLQMRQLLQNLISNALKFHRFDSVPVVKIYNYSMSQEQQPVETVIADFCQIFIEDNGIGFDEKYLDRIFNVFQRLHSRSEYEGTGVGLAICRKIVERHGGSITAKSTPGEGATFIVRLPISNCQ